MKVTGYINPFSNEYQAAVEKFHQIDSTMKKTAVIALTIFSAVMTAFLLGWGAVPAYRLLIEKFSSDVEKVDLEVKHAGQKEGSFVDVINNGTFTAPSGEIVKFPPPSKPVKYELTQGQYEREIAKLKQQITLCKNPTMTLVDMSTEEAIAKENGCQKIALNFANENHAGGGPGMHLDKKTGKIVYDGPSAKAQEESLCQHTDLMRSLTMLDHEFTRGRSRYTEAFNSEEMAYVSQNHLFALRGEDFYDLRYLDKAHPVSFVTSAAPYLRDKVAGRDDYQSLEKRIKTHLFAAAKEAVRIKKETPGQTVELILGAFGCGAFAPKNAELYAQGVLLYYQEELPSFKGIFDRVTFAVPTFGSEDEKNACVRNMRAFQEVFSSPDKV